ncbi:hypothetical protein AB835_12945 [Candidatus Endobugula sertula]|uniref:Uncharacterized protein n=1 Tax=Candidatus Endobugula sertula TaxID=62101 RepID=A0A1D2QM71_9GAMM|nr:hypothetical protein AB835_12945 [Candidatus Endobugula sertula]
MIKWIYALSLSIMFYNTSALADFDCEKEMLSETFHDQKEMFRKARDKLFNEAHLDKYHAKIVSMLRKSSAENMSKSLWVVDIPDMIDEIKEQLDTPEGGWENRLTTWKKSVEDLEEKARCFHYGLTDQKTPVMFLKLYDHGDDKPVIAGYLTTTSDGSPSSTVRYTRPEDCSSNGCQFQDSSLKGFDSSQFTAIRLVHNPESLAKLKEDLVDNETGLADLSYLKQLEIKKTGEMFTDPEIIAAVAYRQEATGEKETVMVDIPWALKKGDNRGHNLLLNWRDYTHVNIVLYEDDLDIPYGKILKLLKACITASIEATSGDTLGAILSGAREAFKNRNTGSENDLIEYMDGLGNDDLIDEFVISREMTRDKRKTDHTGKESIATMHLHHMSLVPAETDVDSTATKTDKDGIPKATNNGIDDEL